MLDVQELPVTKVVIVMCTALAFIVLVCQREWPHTCKMATSVLSKNLI